jgi:hypothetical protein
MINETIDYNALIDEAMHSVVKRTLESIHNDQIPGEHHFLISFFTKHKGVTISSRLLEKYPEEMTIILQHQFENLTVNEDKFSVILTFGGIKELLEIPYQALISFVDPSVNFGLHFRHEVIQDKPAKKTAKITPEKSKKEKLSKPEQSNNVITLDQFRKKRNQSN